METTVLREGGRLKDIRAFIDSLYRHDLHAKRVASLAAATLGVMTGASLAVAMIGQALAHLIHGIAGIRWRAWYNHLVSRRV